ncbi:MAG: ribonuclease HI [Lachnospiraceae bacterium]|nr:ribonuclease HI [Lachnospiraceae bacterium]
MKVTVYSDGSSRGNPGPGGFGTLIHYVDTKGELHTLEITKGYKQTTNNRMELLGVISGLEALTKPCEVKVVSDSKYVIDAFNQKWIDSWVKNNWKRKSGPVLNVDLWKRLLKAMEPHSVSFEWIKGHAGHPENERCDKLATQSADSDNLLIDEGFLS